FGEDSLRSRRALHGESGLASGKRDQDDHCCIAGTTVARVSRLHSLVPHLALNLPAPVRLAMQDEQHLATSIEDWLVVRRPHHLMLECPLRRPVSTDLDSLKIELHFFHPPAFQLFPDSRKEFGDGWFPDHWRGFREQTHSVLRPHSQNRR